jgi:hypothetical protein
MLNFYAIMVGLVFGGIGFVIFLLANDKSSSDQLEQISITDILSDKNIEIDLSEALPGKEDKLSAKEKPLKKPGGSFFARFFKKAGPSEEIIVPARKSVFQKLSIAGLADKIPFLKKRRGEEFLSPEECDDLMTRTLKAQLGLQENKKPDKENNRPSPSGENRTSSMGTASLKVASEAASDSELPLKMPAPAPAPKLTPAESAALDQGIESSMAHAELQQKHARVEKILKERTGELERLQHDLQNEISNRKEFNKVKDLLEKELADAREKARLTNNALRAAEAESGTLQKRIRQMEDKISRLEKGLLAKEQEIQDIFTKKSSHPPPASQPKENTNNADEGGASPATEAVVPPPAAAAPDKARRVLEEALKDPCLSSPDPEPAELAQPFDIDLSSQAPGSETETDDRKTPGLGPEIFQAPSLTDGPPAEEGDEEGNDDDSPPDFLPLRADVMNGGNTGDPGLRQQPATDGTGTDKNKNDSSAQKSESAHPEEGDARPETGKE